MEGIAGHVQRSTGKLCAFQGGFKAEVTSMLKAILMLLACLGSCKALQAADDRGFWTQFSWYSFDEARDASLRTGLPVVYIIHKSWCRELACDSTGSVPHASPCSC